MDPRSIHGRGNPGFSSNVSNMSCERSKKRYDDTWKLGISIIPMSIGMITARKGETAETMVHQGSGDVHYYWTLDLSTSRPDQLSGKVLTTPEERLVRAIIDRSQIRCISHLGLKPHQDLMRPEKVMKLGPQRITVKAIYTDGKQMAGCSVIISEAAQQLFRGKVPHVSLAKCSTVEWKDLASLVEQGEHTSWWQQAGGGWETDMHSSIFRKKLGWVTHATTQLHLEGSENEIAE